MSKRKKLGLTRKDWKAHKALTKDVKCANTAINYYAAVTITIERNVMATVPVASVDILAQDTPEDETVNDKQD